MCIYIYIIFLYILCVCRVCMILSDSNTREYIDWSKYVTRIQLLRWTSKNR